jgi:hypothetical protein
VALAPFGIPAPLSVALVDATLLAALVVAVAVVAVVNDIIAPNAVPSVLATIAQ